MNYRQEMADARCRLEESVAKWNRAQREEKLDDLKVADKECEEAKKAFITASKMSFYEKCFDTADPLYEAVKILTYDGIGWVDKTPKDSDRPVREIKNNTIFVRLEALKKYAKENAGRELGADEKWGYMVEKFNQLMTFYAAQELKVDPKTISDNYRISELAKEVEMGKTPTSKTQIQKQLQQVVTAMLGEGNEEMKFNVTSHDAAYVMLTFARTSRTALSVKAKSPRDMYATLAQVCHRIVHNRNYQLEYFHKKS